tara:strand:- start:2904 stop:3629 length:726 start_codon:yes stop_codon:yes gene_type:complete
MKIYITACNKYTHICPTALEYLNNHWPNQDITIIGYESVKELKNLPDNVDVEFLGKQQDFGESWTTALIPFFQDVPEDYFVILLEDLIIMNPMDMERIDALENQIRQGNAQKALIGGGLPLSATKDFTENLLVFNQDLNYRATLHPAIWNKQYFLKYLKPNMTPWQFEVRNNNAAKYDGANIIANKYVYPEEPHPFSFLNVYTKGKLMITEDGEVLDNQPSSKFFNKEHIKDIWRKINATR